MSANFDLSNLALRAVCPGNELLYDDAGLPSVMVKIPKMTYKELGMGDSTAVHPAFIVNGTEVDAIWISKYQNIINGNRAYSLPGVGPKHSLDFDAARAACEAKGEGWHLMTRMEWGMLVRWCQKNGVMPKGNNNYGKHNTETVYKAIPDNTDASHYALRTKTGTGPLTWYHDQTPSGIADLCGNVNEWTGGIRLVKGEVQILANNNGADSAKSQSAESTEWKAIKGSDGSLITPNGAGTTSGSVKMGWANNKITFGTTKTGDSVSGSNNYISTTFANIECNSTIGDAAKLLLQDLGLLQYGTDPELFASHLVYLNNVDDERLFNSGGNYSATSSGLASFLSYSARSSTGSYLGFRSAFVNLPTA